MKSDDLNVWVADFLRENNSFKTSFSANDLHKIVSCIDLTTLNASDSPKSVSKFVTDGQQLLKANNLPNVAAYCVFSNFTSQVKEQLNGTGISTACVATAFPHGQASLNAKVAEVVDAEKHGADDIDIVINRGLVLDGDFDQMAVEVAAFKNAAGKAHLKVILEVCELSLEQVYEASKRSIESGTDFLKTSTGKGSSGASLEATLVMCKAIKEHFDATSKMVGFKAAGGISTSENAMQYWNAVQSILGKDWMNNTYFRIGASSLLKNIISDLS